MSEVVFPEGWAQCLLGDVVSYGKTEKIKIDDVELEDWILELEDIEKNSSKLLARVSVEERQFKSTKNVFQKGDVLYGKLRPYLNKVILADRNGICSTEIIPINAEPFIYNPYLFHWLKSEAFQTYVNSVSYGVNMPRLGTKDGNAAPLILAPLAEQKEISERLDNLLAQVDSIKTRLDAIPAILKRFRQSVLTAAVSGKLTEGWRNSDECNQWERKKLSDVCLSISDGDHQAPPKAESGTPFLVISNLNSGEIDFDGVRRWVPREYFESLKSIRKPERNDVLYTVTGSFGIPVLVETDEAFCFQRHIAILKPDHENVDCRYLRLLLESPEAFQQAMNVATGTAQKTVPLKGLRAFEFIFPTLEEQIQIVRRIEQLFVFADQIETQVKNAQTRVNNLTQSILAKAFRGELTADWRAEHPELISGENSAQALLEKIKVEREMLNSAKTAGNRKKAKS